MSMILLVVFCGFFGDIAITARVSENAVSSILMEESEDEDLADAQPVSFTAVTANSTQIALMKVTKTDMYMKSWPRDCSGKNGIRGQFIADSEQASIELANGFRCHEGSVYEIFSPEWMDRGKDKAEILAQTRDICCNGVCVSSKSCGVSAYDFATAAANTIGKAALKVNQIRTKTGKKVQVNVETAPPEITKATSVLAAVEVRMLGELKFVNSKAILTEEGAAYLDEIASSLGSLVSMQMAAFPASNPAVLLCVHGETAFTLEALKAIPMNVEHLRTALPMERAKVVRAILESKVPSGLASLGAPNAHFNEEQAVLSRPGMEPERFVYKSGIRAFIIYKLYDPEIANELYDIDPNSGKRVPPCAHEDLYPFVRKYADQNVG